MDAWRRLSAIAVALSTAYACASFDTTSAPPTGDAGATPTSEGGPDGAESDGTAPEASPGTTTDASDDGASPPAAQLECADAALCETFDEVTSVAALADAGWTIPDGGVTPYLRIAPNGSDAGVSPPYALAATFLPFDGGGPRNALLAKAVPVAIPVGSIACEIAVRANAVPTNDQCYVFTLQVAGPATPAPVTAQISLFLDPTGLGYNVTSSSSENDQSYREGVEAFPTDRWHHILVQLGGGAAGRAVVTDLETHGTVGTAITLPTTIDDAVVLIGLSDNGEPSAPGWQVLEDDVICVTPSP